MGNIHSAITFAKDDVVQAGVAALLSAVWKIHFISDSSPAVAGEGYPMQRQAA